MYAKPYSETELTKKINEQFNIRKLHLIQVSLLFIEQEKLRVGLHCLPSAHCPSSFSYNNCNGYLYFLSLRLSSFCVS